jgi:hypothetical protein
VRAAVFVVVAVVVGACGGPRELAAQAPGAVAVYANVDSAGWEPLTASGSGAYAFQAYQQYEVGEQCLLPGSGPQRYTYEVLATIDDDDAPLQLLACGALPTPLTLDVEMRQPGRVLVGNQGSSSETGPWVATLMVAAARYDVAAADATRLAVVRDVRVDAETTVSVDLDTDGATLETFPVAVSAVPTSSIAFVDVLYTLDQTDADVVAPVVDLSSASLVNDGTVQLAALPPSGLERADAQSVLVFDAGEPEEESVQTATLDSHDVALPPLPQLNVGDGRVAGSAVGDATSVSFTISSSDGPLGEVWMSRGWLDNQPDPTDAAFDNTIPAFDGSATLTVANLNVCTTTQTESVCAN